MITRKTAVFLSALCILAGGFPVDAGQMRPVSTVYAADEDAGLSIKVEIDHVGEISEVSVGNTEETPRWYSDDEKIATVEATDGLKARITAVGKGSTTVYAVLSKQLLKFEVIVKAEADTSQNTVHIGDVQLTNSNSAAKPEIKNAGDGEITWSSSDESVAKVSRDGTITAAGKGTCTVSALIGNTLYTIGVTSTYDPETAAAATAAGETPIGEMTLTNAEPSRKISADLPSGVKIKWSSTDEKVATVSEDGTVTAVGKGECRIYAEIAKQKYFAEVKSEYDPSAAENTNIGDITLSDKSPSQALTLNNVSKDVEIKWSSKDETIAKVDNNGVVTAVGSGKTVITAQVGDKTYTVNVTSTYTANGSESSTVEIKGIGNTVQLSSAGMGENVEWISMNKDIAVVDDKGKVTAKSVGEALIVANSGKTSVSVTVKVTAEKLVGDANCDGSVSLSDALLILQYVANATKYPLSEQGKINADAYGGNDGITAKDALAIQMLDAKMVDSLPVTE